MTTVSRELVRAVLEMRDRRHNETHSALVAMYQALAAELIAAGAVRGDALAARIDQVRDDVAPDAQGATARAMLDHMAAWVGSLPPAPPYAHPERWNPPAIDYDGDPKG